MLPHGIDETQKHFAKRKNLDIKQGNERIQKQEYMLHDPIYMKFLEQAKLVWGEKKIRTMYVEVLVLVLWFFSKLEIMSK